MNFSIPFFVNIKLSNEILKTNGESSGSVKISAEQPSFVVGYDIEGPVLPALSGKISLQM